VLPVGEIKMYILLTYFNIRIICHCDRTQKKLTQRKSTLLLVGATVITLYNTVYPLYRHNAEDRSLGVGRDISNRKRFCRSFAKVFIEKSVAQKIS